MFFSRPKRPSDEQIQHLTGLFSSGQLDDLITQAGELVRRFPKSAQLHNILAVAYNAVGDFHAAVDSAEQAVRIQPDYAKALVNLGNALANIGEQQQALESYRQAVLAAPDMAEAHNNLGAFLVRLERHEEAVACFRRALELQPAYIKALNNLGCAQLALGRNEDAIASFDEALALKPDYAEACNNLGGALRDAGRKQESVASFRRAIELNPHYTEAYRQLADLIPFTADEPLYVEMQDLLASGTLSDDQRMHLCFALGKAEEDMGAYEQAFRYLQQGNRLRKAMSGYHIEEDRHLFALIKDAFRAAMPAPASDGPLPATPLFIVGMPRSGTTLLEQILCSHSDVYGAGEVATLDHAMNYMAWGASGVTMAQLQQLRRHYASWLQALDVEEGFVTDKAMLNFRWIGFILLAMPEARIIHIRRDARATCWSIYRHFFGSNGLGYAYDPEDVAEYYGMYLDLMAFWEQRFPGRIHHLDYEALTEAQEEQTRAVLEYCGLPWQAECLDFHRNKRAVATASSEQVRARMYQGSSDAWRRYEAWLQPMLERLEDIQEFRAE